MSSRSEAVRLENYIKGRKSKAYKAKLADDPKAVEKLLDKLSIQEAEQ